MKREMKLWILDVLDTYLFVVSYVKKVSFVRNGFLVKSRNLYSASTDVILIGLVIQVIKMKKV